MCCRRVVGLCFVAVLVAAAGCTPVVRQGPARRGSDPAVRMLLEVITSRQPKPYGLPEKNTYNYIWAQYMMSFLAAERCGYMSREEAVARLKGMLDVIEKLERYHGFFYDRYDLATGKKDTDQIYFQGWWIFGLAVLRNAYQELAPQCDRLLSAIDYEKGEMFNPETLEMAADFWPEEKRHNWINFYWGPGAEMRSPYVAYTYLTGDIRPWTKKQAPGFMDVEGHSALRAWHNFVFCSMLMHSVFADLGYFERSWEEMIQGLDLYKERNGMIFYPTRAEPLETWAEDMFVDRWMNTEHRIAKPWLAWYGDPDAPAMDKAFIPGSGITLYYDNMNLYWCYGDQMIPSEDPVGAGNGYQYTFFAMLVRQPDVPHPARLTSVKLIASRNAAAVPAKPLEVRLNGDLLAAIEPARLSAEPQQVDLPLDVVLVDRTNWIQVVSADTDPRAYTLYRREHPLLLGDYMYGSPGGRKLKEVAPPYLEITIDGQHDGGESPYALLARCAVVHGYYVWHEMLNDPQFLENTVVWVGDYYDRARIGRVVHNTSDSAVKVRYERPEAWTRDAGVTVADITDGAGTAVPVTVAGREINWQAEPWHTYRIGYSD